MKKTISVCLAMSCLSVAARSQPVQPVEKNADTAGVYAITRYGAVGDGRTLNTAAIQRAVDACHLHGGGRVVIPTGNFITGTVRLYSDMDLYLESGSVLTGSTDDKDYRYQKEFGFSGPGAGVRTGLLVAHGEHNISVSGYGTLNGNGTHFMVMDSLQQGQDLSAKFTRQKSDYMDPKWGRADGPVMWKGTYEERAGVMAIFSSCKNIRLSNITFRESPNWTIAFLNSEDVKVTGLTIDNNMNIPNSDGIDMYDSRNITISDCVIQAGDDAIAVISSSRITAMNCVLHSRSCGIRVGYNVFNTDNSGDLLFDNISIYDSNRGIGIFQRQKGDMKNMVFSNIIIGTRLHSGQWWGHGEPIHISSVPGLGSKETGSIAHVRFSNITASSESGIVVYASAKGLIHDIGFENIDLSLRQSPLAGGYGGNIDLRPTNDLSLGIFAHNIAALYSVFADNLVIRNMDVHWGKGLPDYFIHAVDCEDFGTVTVEGVREDGDGDKRRGATVYLRGGKGAKVSGVVSVTKEVIPGERRPASRRWNR